jgi:hypothetical protein
MEHAVTHILICEACGVLSGAPYNCDYSKIGLTQKMRKLTRDEWASIQDEPPHPNDVAD